MEDFIVSARKYRPSTFKSVVGQEAIVSTLKNAIANRHLAHSFLFCGQRGVGKTSCARILAKTINCEHLTPEGEACNKCDSCISFNDGRSLNIHELDAASNNSVDDIRLLIEQVRSAPQAGKYKVYIIDEVHMLSTQAFNAFLKTLEEPPSYAIFILATTEKHKIIPTILSRCQIFDFKRIQLKDVAGHLQYISVQEGITADPEALHIIAEKSDGSMRDALSIYDQMVSFAGKQLTYKKVIDNLNILDYNYYFRITDGIAQGDVPQVLLIFDEILANGFDGLLFIGGLSEHFRNLVVAKNPATAPLVEKGVQMKEKYVAQAALCTENFLFGGLSLLNQCGINYKMAVNQRLLVEITLIRLCSPQLQQTTTAAPLQQPVRTTPAKTASQADAKIIKHTEAKAAAAEPANNNSKPSAPAETAKPKTTPKPNFLSVHKLIGDEPAAGESKTVVKATGETKPVSEELLLQSWSDYIEMNKEKKRSLCSIMTLCQPIKAGDTEAAYEITVGNSVQMQTIEEHKNELLDFLRSRLHSDQLKLNISISKAEVKSKPYTAQEKFEYMKNKNADVAKLSDQLGLELP